MPRVPEYNNLQVMPNITLGTRLQAVDPSLGQSALANTRSAIGDIRAAQKTNVAIAVDYAEQANALRVNEALAKLQTEEQRLTYDKAEGYTTILGGNALNRGEKGSLDVEYGTRLKDYGDQLRLALGNDAQRKLFDTKAMGVYSGFSSGLQKHMLKQFYAYGDAVRDQQAQVIAQGMILTDDPEVIANGVDQLRQLAEEQAATYGTPVDTVKLSSPVLRRVIESKISNGYLSTAKALTDTFEGYINAEDMAQLKKAYQEESENARAVGAAQHAFDLSKKKGMQAATDYLNKLPYNIQQQAAAGFQGRVTRDDLVQKENDRNGTADAVTLIESGYRVSRATMREWGMSEEAQKKMQDYYLSVSRGERVVTDPPTYIDLARKVDLGVITDVKDIQAHFPELDNKARADLQRRLLEQQQGGSAASARGRGRQSAADAAEQGLVRLKKNASPEEIMAARVYASELYDQYVENNKKLPDDPKNIGFSALTRGDAQFSSDRGYTYRQRGEADQWSVYWEGAALDSTALRQAESWRGKSVDDQTMVTFVATNPESYYFNRDVKTRRLIDNVIAKYQRSGQFLTQAEAARIVNSWIIDNGRSYGDINAWASPTNLNAERVAGIQNQVFQAEGVFNND